MDSDIEILGHDRKEVDGDMSFKNILEFSDEILLRILYELEHHEDIVNVSQTCSKLNRLVMDRSLCESLEFSWNIHIQRISLVKFLHDPHRLNLIAKLNFNDLYWVPSGIIRDIVIKLPHLKEFYSAGTQFGWFHLNQFMKTTSERFTHLSWTWDIHLEEGTKNLCQRRSDLLDQIKDIQTQLVRLRCLVLLVPGLSHSNIPVSTISTLSYFVSMCKGLEELWLFSWPNIIQDRKLTSMNYTAEIFHPEMSFPKLNTFILNTQAPNKISVPRLIGSIIENLPQSGSNERQPLKKLCIDHDLADIQYRYGMDLSSVESLSVPLISGLNPGYQNFNLVKCKALLLTHGSSATEALDLNGFFNSAINLEKFSSKCFNYTLDWDDFIHKHLKLEEVNVSQDSALPYPDYCIALSLLKNLKKVSIPEDSLLEIVDARIQQNFETKKLKRNIKSLKERQEPKNSEATTSASTAKRRRVAHRSVADNSERICGLDFLTSFCPEIDEFELGYSSKLTPVPRPCNMVIESLFSIRNFKKLTKLTLDRIPIVNGSFLIDIANACKLESLRLSNLGLRGRCVYMTDLCNALQIMTELKDFRLEQNNIGSSNKLFTALASCKKFERIAILCTVNDIPLSGNYLEMLMKSCVRLSVLFIVMDKTTKIFCQEIAFKLISLFKGTRPPLSIIIRNGISDDERIKYPSVHCRQLIANFPQVCAYKEFPKFT